MTVGSRNSVAFGLAVACLLSVTPVGAHHSAAAAYDETKRVEAQGTVTRVLVRNPHSWVFLESTDSKGQKIEWQIEMGGAPSMGASLAERRSLAVKTRCTTRKSVVQ